MTALQVPPQGLENRQRVALDCNAAEPVADHDSNIGRDQRLR